MVFNFEKIENKSLGVSPIIPVLLKKNDDNETSIIDILQIFAITEVCKLYKITSYKQIFSNENKKINKIKKADVIRSENIKKCLRITVSNLFNDTYILHSICDYILEALFIIDKKIKKDDIYILYILYSFDYLSQKYKNEKFLSNITENLRTFLPNARQINVMTNVPKLFHSDNLINITKSNVCLFNHQKEFIRILNTSTKNVIINASPIGTGKSVLQTYTCLNVHKQNLHKYNKHILLITCKNKYVIEEIARGCNVENNITYWFYYDKKLVPSLFSQPKLRNGRYHILKKPSTTYSIEKQYQYYIDRYHDIQSTERRYNKNISFPDVIFCEPNDAYEIMSSQFHSRIKNIVIDEFLIPGFGDLLNNTLEKCTGIVDNIILLSASAPSNLEQFKEEYSTLYDLFHGYDIHYLYDKIIPSFVRFHDINDHKSTWLPTNELNHHNFRSRVNSFNWYHIRFYSPFVLHEMIELVNNRLGYQKYKLFDNKIYFMSISDMFQLSENFLHELCKESDDIIDLVCDFKPSSNYKDSKKKWMIVSNDPLKRLLENCTNLHNIEEIIDRYETLNETNKAKKLEIEKKFNSFKKNSSKNTDLLYIQDQEVELEIEMQSLDVSPYVSLSTTSNTFHIDSLKTLLKQLYDMNFTLDDINKIFSMMAFGNVIHSGLTYEYTNIVYSSNFTTNNIYVNPLMCYGTDMSLYGVKIYDDVDPITLVQAFGRAGRDRKYIEVPVFSKINSVKALI